MASPHSFHEWAAPVSDTVDSLSSASGPRPPSFAYAFCSLAASFDSMVKMAS